MANSDFHKYFLTRPNRGNERNRTVNIPESTHSFYKNTATGFDVSISDLIVNVLEEWKESHSDDIKSELINNIRKQFKA